MPVDTEGLFRMMIPHLAGQFERAQPVLFTGAGFSMGARNVLGTQLPSTKEVREALWRICYPGETADDGSTLQDLYAQAQLRHPGQLKQKLTELLTVDANTLPEFYRTILNMPWFRCYTLNIDDLETAAHRKFSLARPPAPVSATAPSSLGAAGVSLSDNLEFVHLNGTLADIPENATFSPTQYGERLSRHEPWYAGLVSNLVSHSVVFIGTQLDEPPLWQHLELRRMRGARQMQELRPRSYLITPGLSLARQALLNEFNVFWVPMTAEQFSSEVLSKMTEASATGMRLLGRVRAEPRDVVPEIPEVADLAQNPMQSSEFLVGNEPIWADLQSGRAVVRDNDHEIWKQITARRAGSNRGFIAITGTAGSGKSTAMMRACLRLSADGVRVAWLDRSSELSPREIRSAMHSDSSAQVLAIDDADLFSTELASLIKDVSQTKNKPLVIIAVRSGKIDRVLDSAALQGVPSIEIAVPHLTDSDIGALLNVLDRENRLGVLKAKPRPEQEALFRNQAGRQLLVAMIQATSGAPLKEKVVRELDECSAEGRHVYALIAGASGFRFSLSKDEVLIATGDRTNAALNALEQLVRRHIVDVNSDGSFKARHRVIADLLFDQLQKTGELRGVLEGLAFVAATKVDQSMRRSARPWRMLRAVINHDFLARTIYPEAARSLYASLEQLLSWDFQYLLQRGSLEVEFGDVALAENFLSQARSLAPDDPFVLTEWGYLLFSKAHENPHSLSAPDFVRQATDILEELIDRPAHNDPYPYHVLGSQGLRWASKRHQLTVREREVLGGDPRDSSSRTKQVPTGGRVGATIGRILNASRLGWRLLLRFRSSGVGRWSTQRGFRYVGN